MLERKLNSEGNSNHIKNRKNDLVLLDPSTFNFSNSKLETLSGGYMVRIPVGSIEYFRACLFELMVRTMTPRSSVVWVKKVSA
jgi:hypothetical protein